MGCSNNTLERLAARQPKGTGEMYKLLRPIFRKCTVVYNYEAYDIASSYNLGTNEQSSNRTMSTLIAFVLRGVFEKLGSKEIRDHLN